MLLLILVTACLVIEFGIGIPDLRPDTRGWSLPLRWPCRDSMNSRRMMTCLHCARRSAAQSELSRNLFNSPFEFHVIDATCSNASASR